MPIPTFTTGQVVAASDVNSWFVPLAATKANDQSVTSSTVLVSDSDLVLSVAASATYVVSGYLNYAGAAQGTGDLKLTFTVPAGATLSYTLVRMDTAGATGLTNPSGATVTNVAGTSAVADRSVFISATLVLGGTAGSLQLQWAQNTSSTTATVVRARSWLWAQRIA